MTDTAYMLVREPARMYRLGYTVAAEPSEVSLDERRAARSALRRGCVALGLDDAKVRVRWVHQAFGDTPGAERTKTGHPIGGRFDPSRDWQIELRAGRPLEDIRRSCFHELRHLAQQCWRGLPDGPADREWRERDASAWAALMMGAAA